MSKDLSKWKRWIKNGIAVVHISNLDVILTVDKVVYRSFIFDVEGEQKKRVSRIEHIKCKMQTANGVEYIKHFSKELVPLEVAQKGMLESIAFINREGKYKE